MKFPKLGKFWEVKPPLRSQKWDFFGKTIIIFLQLHFGNIMVVYPILGKKWDMNFLLWENIRQKIGKILSWRKYKLLFWENIGKS